MGEDDDAVKSVYDDNGDMLSQSVEVGRDPDKVVSFLNTRCPRCYVEVDSKIPDRSLGAVEISLQELQRLDTGDYLAKTRALDPALKVTGERILVAPDDND